MRRTVSLLTAVVTAVAVGALPLASASASTLAGNPGVMGTGTTSHAISSQVLFVKIEQPSSPQNSGNQHPKKRTEPFQQTLCLTNSSGYCAAINPMDVLQAILDNDDLIKMVIDWVRYKIGSHGPEETPQGEGDENRDSTDTDENNGGESAGLCLQSTGGDVAWADCNGSGTVWIAESHNSGIYLVNRYLLDHGTTKVLTVANNTNGDRLYVAGEGASGTWQNWTWHPYCDGCIS